MSVDPERVQAIFTAAVEQQDAAARAAVVDRLCGTDADLRQRVETLLKAHEAPGSFLECSGASQTHTAEDRSASERPGTMIGPYKLLEQIGEGGFGVVYMAEQTEPVRRKVALRILKPGMDTRQIVARFEAERQALAIMDHPNIAKVFDGGSTEPAAQARVSAESLAGAAGSGRPYFVMELVKGIPITEYCDQNHLTPRQRLELFIPVCQAVQHAHQKGIIHRDLKPSNVLVTRHDSVAVPKVIDFGVAKALGQELTDKTLFTGIAQMIGTPLYMSPEQAGMSDLDVDTRSDIYSLGVLLYELLTGTTPFEKERFKTAAFDEIRRIIREEEPPKPSTRLSALSSRVAPQRASASRSDATTSLASVAAVRQTEPVKLTKLVRGELDWIVMKALEKDRNRRYETANGFANDIQRYLADEAVQACPPSVGYRLRKFARRNKAAIIMTSVIGVALLLAVGSLGWVLRDREAGRVRTANEINQFLDHAESLYADNKLPEAAAEVQRARGVLEAGSADEALGRRIRQWLTDLDTAAKLEEIRLDDSYDRNREYADYTRVFREYGIDVEAMPVEEAVARIADSQIKPDLILALGSWAQRLKSDPRGQDPARLQRLLTIARASDPDPLQLRLQAALEAKDVQTLRDLANGANAGRLRTRPLAFLGFSLCTAGDAEAAVEFLRRVQRQYPSDFLINFNLAFCLGELKPPPLNEVIEFRRLALAARPQSAWAHSALGDALRLKNRLDEAILEHREAVRLSPGNANIHNGLGLTLRDQKKLGEAIAEYRTAISIDPQHALAHYNLGSALRYQKKLDEAIAEYHKALAIDPNYVWAHNNLGLCHFDRKNLDAAIACYKKAIEIDPKCAGAHCNLGNALGYQKKLNEAVAEYRTAISIDPQHALAHYCLGIILGNQKKLDAAVTEYRRAIALDAKVHDFHYNLGLALHALNRLDEAVAEYREAIALDRNAAGTLRSLGNTLAAQNKLEDAIAAYRAAIRIQPDHSYAHNQLGLALMRQGRLDQAIVCFREAVRLMPGNAQAHYNLGMALSDQKKPDEAIACYRKAIELAPNLADAHNGLGALLCDSKRDYEGAAACFKKAIGIDPAVAVYHYNLGNALRGQKKPDEAIACYRKAIELAPNYSAAHVALGDVLREQGKLDEAITAFFGAIPVKPRDAAAHYGVSLARSAQGRWVEAKAAYQESIRNQANFYQAHRDLALLLTACPDPKLRDPRKAVEHAKKAVTLRLQSSEPLQVLGWAEYRAGNWRESIEALEKSCKLQPGGTGDHSQWIVLALAHARLAAQPGLPEKARETHKIEARRWYEKVDKSIDSKWRVRPDYRVGDLGQPIWDFREEARALMPAKVDKK